MRMDVIPVRVGCHHNFKAGDLLCQFQCNLMGPFRRNRIVGTEGLEHVIVHPTAGAVVQSLGIHELLQCSIRHTVDAGYERTTFAVHLLFSAAVLEDTVQTTHRLCPAHLYEIDHCHHCHRLRLRISESKEPTAA